MRNREKFYTFAFYLKKTPNRYTWVAIKVGMVVVRGTCCWCLCHWRILLDNIWLNGVDWTWSPFFQYTRTARVGMTVIRVTCYWFLLHWRILLDNIWQNGVHCTWIPFFQSILNFMLCKGATHILLCVSKSRRQVILIFLTITVRLVENVWLQHW